MITCSQPTCNSIHEMDTPLLLRDDAFSLVSDKGYWRRAWKVDLIKAEANGDLSEERNDGAAVKDKYAVMKSLK